MRRAAVIWPQLAVALAGATSIISIVWCHLRTGMRHGLGAWVPTAWDVALVAGWTCYAIWLLRRSANEDHVGRLVPNHGPRHRGRQPSKSQRPTTGGQPARPERS